MPQVIPSPSAEADLRGIWHDIAWDNPAAASRVLKAIGARIHQLADNPRLGPKRTDLLPRARVLVEGPYLILYEIHPDTVDSAVDVVEIVRIVDSRRDLSKPF